MISLFLPWNSSEGMNFDVLINNVVDDEAVPLVADPRHVGQVLVARPNVALRLDASQSVT